MLHGESCRHLPSPSHCSLTAFMLSAQLSLHAREAVYTSQNRIAADRKLLHQSLRHTSHSLGVCWLELTLRTLMWLLFSLFFVVLRTAQAASSPDDQECCSRYEQRACNAHSMLMDVATRFSLVSLSSSSQRWMPWKLLRRSKALRRSASGSWLERPSG